MKFKSKFFKSIALLAVFCFLMLGFGPSQTQAAGNVYYISTGGSDSQGTSGQIGAPFRTLARALTVMGPGDKAYIRQGTYDYGGFSTGNGRIIPSGTSWNNATTIASYPGERATIQFFAEGFNGRVICSFGFNAEAFTGSPDQYIILQNLTMDGSGCGGGNGIFMNDNTHHVRIQGSEIKNYGTTDQNGAGMGMLIGHNSHHIEILNNDIHDILGPDSLSGHGMYFEASDSLLDGNLIHNNSGVGIQIQDAAQGFGAYRNIFRNNQVYNNGVIGGLAAVDGQDNQIYNNLFYGNSGEGVSITPVGFGTPSADRNLVYNNTIYGNTGHCIAVGYFGPADSNRIYNNICYGNGTDDIQQTGAATNTFIQSNLMGVNPGFMSSTDFHLTQNSFAAKDNGTNLSSVLTTDFDGTARPQNGQFDIGAYEFCPNGCSSGPTPVPPPPPSSYIPRAQMHISTATTDSGNAPLVLDGDLDTRWLSSGGFPQEVVIYLGAAYSLTGLNYTSNGWTGVNGYEVYVSADGTNWGSAVATGNMPVSGDIAFAAKNGRMIKFKPTSSTTGGTYGYVSELNFTGTGISPLLGDLNIDHIVNSIDYSVLNAKWFSNDKVADLNADGIVNAIDYSLLNSNWFKTW